MFNKSTEWIKNLKPGDYVLVNRHNGFNNSPETSRGRVFKVTKTTVVLQLGKDENSPGLRFDIDTGIERTTDRWHKAHIEEATPEAIENNNLAWRKYNITNRLKSTNWSRLSISTLQAIERLLRQYDADKAMDRIVNDTTH